MQIEAFHLFLRWMSVEMDAISDDSSGVDKGQELISNVMRHIDNKQRLEIVNFVDSQLATNVDRQSLANLFEDGHIYINWGATGAASNP